MNYWLVKSEPDVYSFDQLLEDKKTFWDGVRNYAARNNLGAMKKGDQAFFYHSNKGKEIVGIVSVAKEAYPDPTTDDDRWVVVDFKPVSRLKRSVTLQEVKEDQSLSGMQLVKFSRLSVQQVSPEEWAKIIQLSES